LCDRDFDCDHCPLDAALRRHPVAGRADEQAENAHRNGEDFPDDRRYTPGHWWIHVQPHGDGDLVRCGLDIFATTIIAHCDGIVRRCSHQQLAAGDPVCEIDFGLGRLQLRAPLEGAVSGWNSSLFDHPGQLVDSPYDQGWIMELTSVDRSSLERLVSAPAMRQKSQFDMQRFRRQIATRALADEVSALGTTAADGGHLVTDLRYLLGGTGYVEMVGELIY
jgi:glycine cleavage system H protein